MTSGAILSMGNNTLTISGGTVDFGSAEGILNQNNANITVNSSLTGTGGLTMTQHHRRHHYPQRRQQLHGHHDDQRQPRHPDR